MNDLELIYFDRLYDKFEYDYESFLFELDQMNPDRRKRFNEYCFVRDENLDISNDNHV